MHVLRERGIEAREHVSKLLAQRFKLDLARISTHARKRSRHRPHVDPLSTRVTSARCQTAIPAIARRREVDAC